MSKFRKVDIVEDRIRQLNSNKEVDWTAVCAHLYTLKNYNTDDEIEKNRNRDALLQSHLNAKRQIIYCLKPLIKINFDIHSMARRSHLYDHMMSILPFIVGYTSMEPRVISYRPVS